MSDSVDTAWLAGSSAEVGTASPPTFRSAQPNNNTQLGGSFKLEVQAESSSWEGVGGWQGPALQWPPPC